MTRTKILTIFAALLCASTLLAQQYAISTIAGGGAPPSSVGALTVRLPMSGGIVLGSTGDVYFSTGNAVMKVDAKGILTRLAGTGRYGYSGDGGPALSAQLAWPAGLAMDGSGNLFIADNANHRIRKVTPAGIISTMVGSTAGYSGDNGPAISAQLNWPTAVAADTSGNVFIADTANQVVRKVSATGVITTIATGLDQPEGVAVDPSGDLYISDYSVSEDDCGDIYYSGRILKVTPDGATTILTPNLQVPNSPPIESPRGITVDATGYAYVADAIADRVWKISPGGVFSLAAGNSPYLEYECPAGYVNPTTEFVCPSGVAIDSSGNLYVADIGHSTIARVSPQGDIANVVGDGAPGNYWGDGGKATDSALHFPLGVVADNAGNLYVSDTSNSRVRKVAPDSTITTVAGNGVSGYSGDGGPATSGQLKAPAGSKLRPAWPWMPPATYI